METILQLNDGRLVVFDVFFNASSENVIGVQVYDADGTAAFAQPVEFGAGTPVGTNNSAYDDFFAFALPGGGVRVLARAGSGTDNYLFDLDASGAVVSTTPIDPSANDASVPYIGVFNEDYAQLADGRVASASRQDLILQGADGIFISNTRRDGPFESVNDSEIIEIAGRILRVSHVNSSDGDVEIRAQFYDSTGALSGDEILVADALDYVTGHWDVEVTELDDGRIAVAYAAARPEDGDDRESAVYLTILNADGTVSVAEQMVNTDDTAGAQDWVNVWALDGGGVAVTYGSETGFTPNDSINVRYFDETGAQYDAFQQTGQGGRGAGNLHVSSDGVARRLGVLGPEELYDAPGPNDPGPTGDELLLSEGFSGELAQDGETATLADGRVVVVYDYTNLRGYVRILDPETGTITTLTQIEALTRELSVAALADGGFAVAWLQGDRPTDEEVRIQVFNADGTVRKAATLAFDGEAEAIQLHPTQTGFVLTYTSDEGTFDDDGRLQFFDASGNALGAATEFHDGFKQEDAVDGALLSGGQTVLTWLSDDPATFDETAHFRIFNADGTAATPVTTIATDVNPYQDVRVASLASGGFITMHINGAGQPVITAYTAQGAVASAPVVLSIPGLLSPVDPGNVTQAFDQVFDIEMNDAGQVVMAFVTYDESDEANVNYAIFATDGTLVKTGVASDNVPDDQSQVELTKLASGDLLLSFTDDTNIQFAQQSSINGTVLQSGGPQTTVIPGTEGADLLTGTSAAEIINGLGGSDWITPGGGNDTVDGGAGNDMVSFSDLAETPGRTNLDYRLTIDLEAGTAVSHDGAERMSLLNLERVTGTIFADFIRGDAGANQLRGLGDYDWFLATTGPDTIDGGNGQDMISFVEWRNAAANTIGDAFGPLPPSGAQATGIYLDLTNPANNTNLAAGLELTSIERITGSGRQDVFFGDDQSNDFRGLGDFDWFVSSDGGRERYFGGDGDDTVTYFNAPGAVTASLRNGAVVNGQQTGYGSQGWAARDLYFEIENLVGSAFDDRLTGSEARNQLNGLAGDDFLFGYGGIDYLKGGLGDDTINGGAGSDYALFDGDRASYTLTRSSGTEVTVSGPDGIDSLTNVEYFRFDDMDVTIWDLAIV